MALQDFYMRSENDPKFKKGIFATSDEDEALFNNIKMIIETQKYDVLGSPEFGCGESEFLFTKGNKVQSLRSRLFNMIKQFSRLSQKRNISVNTIVNNDNGTSNVIFVDIKADGKSIYGRGLL